MRRFDHHSIAGKAQGLFAACGVVMLAVLLSGCSGFFSDKPTFDGERFRTKIDVDKNDRQSFVVRVSNASKTLEGAREAGRYKATEYCIERYGNSAVDWTVGPDSPNAELTIEKDVLFLNGRCEAW